MSSEEKLKLIEKIAQTDDLILLDEIGKLLEVSGQDKVYALTTSQLEMVEVAEKQIKNRDTVDHEESKREMKEWFGK